MRARPPAGNIPLIRPTCSDIDESASASGRYSIDQTYSKFLSCECFWNMCQFYSAGCLHEVVFLLGEGGGGGVVVFLGGGDVVLLCAFLLWGGFGWGMGEWWGLFFSVLFLFLFLFFFSYTVTKMAKDVACIYHCCTVCL